MLSQRSTSRLSLSSRALSEILKSLVSTQNTQARDYLMYETSVGKTRRPKHVRAMLNSDWYVEPIFVGTVTDEFHFYLTIEECKDSVLGAHIQIRHYSEPDFNDYPLRYSFANQIKLFIESNESSGLIDDTRAKNTELKANRWQETICGIDFDAWSIEHKSKDDERTITFLNDRSWLGTGNGSRHYVKPYEILRSTNYSIKRGRSTVAKQLGVPRYDFTSLICHEKVVRLLSAFADVSVLAYLQVHQLPMLQSALKRDAVRSSKKSNAHIKTCLTKDDITFLGEMRILFKSLNDENATAVTAYAARIFQDFSDELLTRGVIGLCSVCNGYFFQRRAKQSCSGAIDGRNCNKSLTNKRFYQLHSEEVREINLKEMRETRALLRLHSKSK